MNVHQLTSLLNAFAQLNDNQDCNLHSACPKMNANGCGEHIWNTWYDAVEYNTKKMGPGLSDSSNKSIYYEPNELLPKCRF